MLFMFGFKCLLKENLWRQVPYLSVAVQTLAHWLQVPPLALKKRTLFFFPFEDLIWNADLIISAIIYADRSPSSRICSSPSLFAAFLQVQPQWFMKWIHEKHRKNQLFRVTCKLNKCLLLANFSTAEAKRTSKIYQHEQFQRGETLFPNKWDACLHPTVLLDFRSSLFGHFSNISKCLRNQQQELKREH